MYFQSVRMKFLTPLYSMTTNTNPSPAFNTVIIKPLYVVKSTLFSEINSTVAIYAAMLVTMGNKPAPLAPLITET